MVVPSKTTGLTLESRIRRRRPPNNFKILTNAFSVCLTKAISHYFLSESGRPTIGAGTLRRAVRIQAFTRILGGRHMECAYLL